MIRYIIRRLLQAIPTLIGVSIISFALAYAAPGDPIQFRTFDPNITEEARDSLRRLYGLDQPVPIQYISWFTGILLRTDNVVDEFTERGNACRYFDVINLTVCDTGGGIIRGDMGRSIQTNELVWDRILDRAPATLELGIASLIFSLLFGIPLGVLAAIYRGSIFDNIVRVLTVVAQAVPNFWLGLMLIFVFGVILGWLPTGGRQTVSLTGETSLIDKARHLLLPSLVLGLGGLALLMRVMRTEVLEVLHNDYVRTARAKGLRDRTVYFTHTLRNALIPLMTILGPAIFGVLGGAVVVETIFSWPGMGRMALSSITQQDYPTALGVVMFFAVFTILGNLFSDILYGVVDPRVRLS